MKSFDAAFRAIQLKQEREQAAAQEKAAKEAVPIAATGAPKLTQRQLNSYVYRREFKDNYVRSLSESGSRQSRSTRHVNLDMETQRLTRQPRKARKRKP